MGDDRRETRLEFVLDGIVALGELMTRIILAPYYALMEVFHD